jgi:hypothetical protein
MTCVTMRETARFAVLCVNGWEEWVDGCLDGCLDSHQAHPASNVDCSSGRRGRDKVGG